MECRISRKSRKKDPLFYNIQAIEICRKSGVKFTYSTTSDLKNDFLVVDNVPEVIEELKNLPCWIKGPKTLDDGRVKFETDWLNI